MNPNISGKLWGETLGNEDRAMQNSKMNPTKRTQLPDPPRHTRFVESSGLERSLSTNIPDHPTAIQVNGLRQERTEHVMCPGHIYGVNSYDARTLCGNWAEVRCDKAYVPSVAKASTGSDWQFKTTYNDMTDNLAHKVLPRKGTNSDKPSLARFTRCRNEPARPESSHARSERCATQMKKCVWQISRLKLPLSHPKALIVASLQRARKAKVKERTSMRSRQVVKEKNLKQSARRWSCVPSALPRTLKDRIAKDG